MQVGNEVGPVNVENAVMKDGIGNIGTPSAVKSHRQVNGQDPALLIKANLPACFERMAFAGDTEILLSFQDQQNGLFCLPCQQSGPGHTPVRLCLL